MSNAGQVRPGRNTLGQIFAVPLLLAVATAAGLVMALVGDGLWDAVSWVALGIPVLVCGICLIRSRGS